MAGGGVHSLILTLCSALTAVIGGGIGGTAAAYFLRQKFGRSVRIELLERGEVGGRLATVEMEGASYEAGGSVLHPLNLHMKHFAKELGEYPAASARRGAAPLLWGEGSASHPTSPPHSRAPCTAEVISDHGLALCQIPRSRWLLTAFVVPSDVETLQWVEGR